MAEDLAPALIQRHFPQRFEELPPAIFLEHYVEERTPQGRLGRKPTWDRLSFHSWAPRGKRERNNAGPTGSPQSRVDSLRTRPPLTLFRHVSPSPKQ
jgi:hypothetical protein